MEWNEMKNVILCREILLIEPYRMKERTVQRAQAWQKVAENHNKINYPSFKVNKRSVREHFKTLEKFKKKNNQEMRASGVSPEATELDTFPEEIAARIEGCVEEIEEENEKKLWKIEAEKEQAQDVRLKAMESLGKTKKG